MRMKPTLAFCLLVSFGFAVCLHAQAPQMINYQGKLVLNGTPLRTPTEITFTIFDAASGGTPLWSEKQLVTPTTDGVFTVILGKVNPFPKDLFTKTGKRFLAMNIGNNPPLPQRVQLTSVAYALNAARADTAQVAFAANRLDAPDGIPTNAVFVDKDGNVGIGTTRPEAKVQIGNILIAGGSVVDKDVLVVTAAAKAFPESDGTIATSDNNWSSNGAYWASPMIYRSKRFPDAGGGIFPNDNFGELMLQGTSHGNVYNRGISFITTPNDNDATSPAIRMRVDPNGNVGIGTTSPLAPFHVAFNEPSSAGITIENTASGGRRYGLAVSANASSVPQGSFFIGDQTSGTEHLVISASGNVGIGTVNPTERLVVAGNIQATGKVCGNIQCPSSRELKENIAALSTQEATAAFENLNPVKFTYKADAQQDLHVGFIAEEVPELLATPDRKGINPMDVIAVLTKVVQEQQKTIADLQSRVKSLEARQR